MSKVNKTFENINNDINERMKRYTHSMQPTEDEVSICWLVCEVAQLRERINAAKNCLVCSAIADAYETCVNTLEILEE